MLSSSSSKITVNFGNVATNYAQFRNDLPDELLESLKLRGIHFDKKKVVDLGAGTGVLTRALHEAGAHVIGVEPSAELIEEAKQIDEKSGFSIEYVQAFADATSLPEKRFDLITVLRAWHWFDRKKTLAEIRRILKEDGKLLVIDSGFLTKNNVVADSIAFIKERLPDGAIKPAGSKADSKQMINSFPVEWFKEWEDHEFALQETYKFDYTVTFSNEAWCGRLGSLSWMANCDPKHRKQILQDLYNLLETKYEGMVHQIEHGCYIAILQKENRRNMTNRINM